MKLQKPKTSDLSAIRLILNQWTDKDEVDKYIQRIDNEIQAKIEFNTRFWVIKNPQTVGIIGISDPLPKISSFFTTSNPIEIKIFYLDNPSRGLGLGKLALTQIEKIIADLGYSEIFIRSAHRYHQTAYGFYQKMGYQQIATIDTSMAVFHKVISQKDN